MPVKNILTNYKPSPKKKKSPFRNQIIELGSKVSSKNKRENINTKKSNINIGKQDYTESDTRNILLDTKSKINNSNIGIDRNFVHKSKSNVMRKTSDKSNYKSVKLSDSILKNTHKIKSKNSFEKKSKVIHKPTITPVSKIKSSNPSRTNKDKLQPSVNARLNKFIRDSKDNSQLRVNSKIQSKKPPINQAIHNALIKNNHHPNNMISTDKLNKQKISYNSNIFDKKPNIIISKKIQERMDKYLVTDKNIEEMHNLVNNTEIKKYKNISFTINKNNYPNLRKLYYPELIDNSNNNYFNKLSEEDRYICKLISLNVLIRKK